MINIIKCGGVYDVDKDTYEYDCGLIVSMDMPMLTNLSMQKIIVNMHDNHHIENHKVDGPWSMVIDNISGHVSCGHSFEIESSLKKIGCYECGKQDFIGNRIFYSGKYYCLSCHSESKVIKEGKKFKEFHEFTDYIEYDDYIKTFIAENMSTKSLVKDLENDKRRFGKRIFKKRI